MVRTARPSSPVNSSRAFALSRDDVTAAAMAMIDADGVARCTMRRLAATLDITGSALYWHFRNRDDLLNAVAVAMLAEVDATVRESEPWPDALRRMLTSVWATARRHPGLLDLLRTQPLSIAPGQRLLASLLVVLRRAGFPPDVAVDHARSLLWTTFGFARGAAATVERLRRNSPDGVVDLQLDLSELDPIAIDVVAECLPRLATLDIDALFAHTVDVAIAGLGMP